MHKETIRLLKASVLTGLMAAVAAQADVVRNPSHFGASIDVGNIVKGTLYEEGSKIGKADGQVLSRTGVYLTESGVINDRLEVRLTLGGLFFTLLPEKPDNSQTRRVLFGAGVGQAQAIYSFGEDPKQPSAGLQFGLFGHNYGESANLGEYLYRSGAYPQYLVTGGWALMQSASYMAQGVRLNVPMLEGKLSHDFTLYMERDIEPAHDISPGYMVTYRPLGFLELGAGGVWSHGLPLKSDKVLTPKVLQNAYSKSTHRAVSGDTTGQGGGTSPSPCATQLADTVAGNPDCGFYTFKGFKVMGRASADIGMLLGVDAIRAGDFKIYTEIALLGVQDYDYVYDDKGERMPIMAGVNVPTFGLLDRLSVEGEYRRTRFPNTIGSALGDQRPLPVGSGESPYAYMEKKNYYKWTAYARRQVSEGVTVHAQAANDHLRSYGTIFANPAHRPTTEKNSDWYYVLRLEFGI
jgi:hypothetical protein